MQHWNTVFLEMFVRNSYPLFYPMRFLIDRILFSPLNRRDMFTQFLKWHIAWYWSSIIYFACRVTVIITPKISAAKLLWPTLWVLFCKVKFNIICYKCFIDSFTSLVRNDGRYLVHRRWLSLVDNLLPTHPWISQTSMVAMASISSTVLVPCWQRYCQLTTELVKHPWWRWPAFHQRWLSLLTTLLPAHPWIS